MVTQNMLRTYKGKYAFYEKIMTFFYLDPNKCLQQIREPRTELSSIYKYNGKNSD